MSVLGTPSSVYYKSEEINKLALNDNIQSLSNQQNDFFYNYITLGLVRFLNFSFDIVKKFIFTIFRISYLIQKLIELQK